MELHPELNSGLNWTERSGSALGWRDAFRIGPLACAGMLSAALGVSLMSGFVSYPIPAGLAWQFTPLGLLQGVSPDNQSLESASHFLGGPGLTLDYFRIFIMTCLLEAPFYLLGLRRAPLMRKLNTLLAANLLTHPAVYFLIPALFERYLSAALVSEAYAAGAEMLVLGWVSARHRGLGAGMLGAGLALLANLFSWQMGGILG